MFVHLRIKELLREKQVSKNQICKDLELPRGNFNRYCRDDFQRIDANLILKLCMYFDCSVAELIEIVNDNEEQEGGYGDAVQDINCRG